MTDLNNFLSDIQNEINVLDDIYKGDYLKYRINNYLVNNDDINIKNFLTNILSKNIGNHVEKLKYMENNSDIVLITQYYEAKNRF